MKLRKVVSLFDGMSCLQIALKEMNVEFETYYASEIDKHAIKQTQLNFPNTVQLGSVTEWRTWNIDWSTVDLIGAGSPCQGFSFAGKQLAFDDPRSKLFFVFIDILNHARKFNPDVKFLLENVDMKREYMRVINQFTGVFPVNINSNLVSAQNRYRNYWSNIRTKQVGLFGEIHTDIPQPKDRGILLKDILESEIDEKYYLKDGHAGNLKTQFQKAGCLTAGAHSGGNHSDMDLIACVKFGHSDEGKEQRRKAMKSGKDHTPFQSREIVGYGFEKMNTITTATTKDNLLITSNYLQIEGSGFDQANRYYFEDAKAPCLGTGHAMSNPQVIQNTRIRRLTPTECSRLQTIPVWYKWECSDTSIYRMLGNGWTIKVIMHILSFL